MINLSALQFESAGWHTLARRVAVGAVLGLFAHGALAEFLRSATAPRIKLHGSIVFDGKPTPAELHVYRQRDIGQSWSIAKATADTNGRYEIALPHADLGSDLTVTANWRELVVDGEDYVPGPNLLPPLFDSPQTSPLRLRGRGAVRSSLLTTLELQCCPKP
jgi:hypothetical protein